MRFARCKSFGKAAGPDRWETIPEKVLVPDWNLMILYTSTFIWDAMVAKYMPCGKFAMDNTLSVVFSQNGFGQRPVRKGF